MGYLYLLVVKSGHNLYKAKTLLKIIWYIDKRNSWDLKETMLVGCKHPSSLNVSPSHSLPPSSLCSPCFRFWPSPNGRMVQGIHSAR